MNRIKQLREEREWTQTQLGEKIQVQAAAISKYETDKVPLTGDTIKMFSDIFNVTTDYLLGNTDDPTPPGAKKSAPTQKEKDALEVYDKLVELNNGNQLTENQKKALLVFLEKNSDYVKFTINETK